MQPRCAILFPLFVAFAARVTAQDWDAYLSGTIRDAATGASIPFATVRTLDKGRLKSFGYALADANGTYLNELYSGAVRSGGYYVVEFGAEGFRSRTALIDLSEVDKGDDAAMAWRIALDVDLPRATDGRTATDTMIASCAWDSLQRTLVWNEEHARRSFPIERFRDERIAAHVALVDSLYALDGMLVDGVVSDHWTAERLANATVRVTAAGLDTVYRTDRYGYYAFLLKKKDVHRLEFSRSGMVAKRLVLDLTTLPEADTTLNYRVALDIRLFDDLAGEDLGFLQEPMGVMRYDPALDTMVWDMAISGPILTRLEAILAKHKGAKAPRR